MLSVEQANDLFAKLRELETEQNLMKDLSAASSLKRCCCNPPNTALDAHDTAATSMICQHSWFEHRCCFGGDLFAPRPHSPVWHLHYRSFIALTTLAIHLKVHASTTQFDQHFHDMTFTLSTVPADLRELFVFKFFRLGFCFC